MCAKVSYIFRSFLSTPVRSLGYLVMEALSGLVSANPPPPGPFYTHSLGATEMADGSKLGRPEPVGRVVASVSFSFYSEDEAR